MQSLRAAVRWLGQLLPGNAQGRAASSVAAGEESAERYCPGGYHPVAISEVFANRYKVMSKIGYGLYSTVWLAQDLAAQSTQFVALKILTSDSYGGSNPTFELDILAHIKKTDVTSEGYKHVIHLVDHFSHQGPNGTHLCLVMELMSQSLDDLQNSFAERQVPVKIVRQVARQLLVALDWLHTSCGVIHTDLKPSNILIEVPAAALAVEQHVVTIAQNGDEQAKLVSRPVCSSPLAADSVIKIKLADFGVASWQDKHLSEWIQPPSLRAPEVFLGAPWTSSVDIWSLACVVYELLQGRVLFRGRAGPGSAWTAEEDQLAQMVELFGPVPASLRGCGRRAGEYFDEHGDFRHIKQLYPYTLADLLAQSKNPSVSEHEYGDFEQFLRSMLRYEPGERKTAKELLDDKWLRMSID